MSDKSTQTSQGAPNPHAAFMKQTQIIQQTLDQVGKTLMVMSGKGGVGKSTVSANLAVSLAEQGKRVGLLDIDIHGPNIPKMLGIEGETVKGSELGMIPVKVGDNLSVLSLALIPGLGDSPVIWRGPIKMNAIRQFLSDVVWGALDYLVVDLPPGTGDEPLTIGQLLTKNAAAVIVTTPQEVSLMDVRKSINFAKQLKIPVAGVVENMAGFICPHCGESTELFGSGGGVRVAEELEVPFLGSIPFEPAIVHAGDSGKPFARDAKDSPAAVVFAGIVEKITGSS